MSYQHDRDFDEDLLEFVDPRPKPLDPLDLLEIMTSSLDSLHFPQGREGPCPPPPKFIDKMTRCYEEANPKVRRYLRTSVYRILETKEGPPCWAQIA